MSYTPSNPELWMQLPAQEGPDNVPSGLLYLTTLDELLIRKNIELIEAQTGVEVRSKYLVKNKVGENIYYVAEDLNCYTRTCGSNASYIPPELRILDFYKNEIMHLRRRVECLSCCHFPCYRLLLEVYTSTGDLIGTVEKEEKWSFFDLPTFFIKDELGTALMKIKSPRPSCCTRVGEFQVLSPDETIEIAMLRRRWGTLMQEIRDEADFFNITYSVDSDARSKALMIGACFLIGYVYNTKNDR